MGSKKFRNKDKGKLARGAASHSKEANDGDLQEKFIRDLANAESSPEVDQFRETIVHGFIERFTQTAETLRKGGSNFRADNFTNLVEALKRGGLKEFLRVQEMQKGSEERFMQEAFARDAEVFKQELPAFLASARDLYQNKGYNRFPYQQYLTFAFDINNKAITEVKKLLQAHARGEQYHPAKSNAELLVETYETMGMFLEEINGRPWLLGVGDALNTAEKWNAPISPQAEMNLQGAHEIYRLWGASLSEVETELRRNCKIDAEIPRLTPLSSPARIEPLNFAEADIPQIRHIFEQAAFTADHLDRPDLDLGDLPALAIQARKLENDITQQTPAVFTRNARASAEYATATAMKARRTLYGLFRGHVDCFNERLSSLFKDNAEGRQWDPEKSNAAAFKEIHLHMKHAIVTHAMYWIQGGQCMEPSFVKNLTECIETWADLSSVCEDKVREHTGVKDAGPRLAYDL